MEDRGALGLDVLVGVIIMAAAAVVDFSVSLDRGAKVSALEILTHRVDKMEFALSCSGANAG